MAGVTPGGRHHRRSRGQNPYPNSYPTDPQPTGPQRLPRQDSVPQSQPHQGRPYQNPPQQPHSTNLRSNVAYMPVPPPIHRYGLQDTHLATPRNVGPNVQPIRQPKPKVSRPVAAIAVAAGVAVGFIGGQILGGPDDQPATAAVQTKTQTEARTVAAPSSPKPRLVKLQDFTGMGAGEAMAWLTGQGWELSDIVFGGEAAASSEAADFWPLDWKVTTQSLPAGRTVKVGTKIMLTCTKV